MTLINKSTKVQYMAITGPQLLRYLDLEKYVPRGRPTQTTIFQLIMKYYSMAYYFADTNISIQKQQRQLQSKLPHQPIWPMKSVSQPVLYDQC